MSQVNKSVKKIIQRMVTIGGQVGEALVLAPLPLAVAYVEVNMNWV